MQIDIGFVEEYLVMTENGGPAVRDDAPPDVLEDIREINRDHIAIYGGDEDLLPIVPAPDDSSGIQPPAHLPPGGQADGIPDQGPGDDIG